MDTDKRAIQVLTAADKGETVVARNPRTPLYRPSGWVTRRGRYGQQRVDRRNELAEYVTLQIEQKSGGSQHPQFARLDGEGDTDFD